MLSTSQKLLHRAKSLRRLHHSSKAAPDETPAMPPSTDRPRTHYGGSSSNASASTAAADDELVLDAFHFRQASNCSHPSRASSSWSSTASTTSSTSSTSASSKIQWDSLRLHPPPMPRAPRYDAGRSFYYEGAAFDFGFDKDNDDDNYNDVVADIHLVSSDEDADVFFQGLSAPPPRHHKLRAHQSAPSLPRPAEPVAESASPVKPRVQQSTDSESDRYFKRGDWKRRGIVFNGYDHVL